MLTVGQHLAERVVLGLEVGRSSNCFSRHFPPNTISFPEITSAPTGSVNSELDLLVTPVAWHWPR